MKTNWRIIEGLITDKYGEVTNFDDWYYTLQEMIECMDLARADEKIDVGKSHLFKDNHKIGIELESYINVLELRGFIKEAKNILNIASNLK